jgi:DNA-directed RNA polymerase subunit beta
MTLGKTCRVTLGEARHAVDRLAEVAPMPNLNAIQRDSFDWFMNEGLKEVFAETSPIDASPSRKEV